jgi:DNA helicase-2/ATP-dependent DNA helicase PcrA
VDEVEKLTSNGNFKFGDCAIMYRTNAQSRALEEAFIHYGMPHKLVAGTRFYERREIRDIISYLRLIHNLHDSISLSRIINVPGRDIGKKTLSQLGAWAKKLALPLYDAIELVAQDREDNPFSSRQRGAVKSFFTLLDELIAESEKLNIVDLLNFVLQRTGYKNYILESADGEERWENILELRTVAEEYRDLEPRDSLASFLEEVSLVSDVDSLDEKADAVTLITLHQAKGLEFPMVFITGVEEGLLPHFKSLDDPLQVEEERRLCYVGITRAKKSVCLTYAQHRSLMGSSGRCIPSRFLKDIPPHLITSAGTKDHFAKATYVAAQAATLKEGDKVRHAKFGKGLIINCTPIKDDYELLVAFRELGMKKLLLSLAPLEKI